MRLDRSSSVEMRPKTLYSSMGVLVGMGLHAAAATPLLLTTGDDGADLNVECDLGGREEARARPIMTKWAARNVRYPYCRMHQKSAVICDW